MAADTKQRGYENGNTDDKNYFKHDLKSATLLRHLLPEVATGYVFWSLFFGLGPMIWFYPLNELDFTGYEAFFGVLLLPAICGWSPIYNIFRTKPGLALLRVIMVVCLASFQAPTTFTRLVILSIGTTSALFSLLVTLWSPSFFHRYVTSWGLIIGFYAVIVSRIWYVTVLPTWSDAVSNQVVLAVGVIATVDRIFNGWNGDASETKPVTNSPPSWFLSGISYGSLLYVLVTIYSEVSVVSRWIVTSYPHPGPPPNPWGAAVLAALICGTALSIYQVPVIKWKLWWIVGNTGIMSLYLLPSSRGFLGGLALAVYIMSMWPEAINNMSSCPPVRTFTLSMLTFMVETLFSIWTVAYNFVPGGEYTREHTGYLLAFVSFTWLCGFTLKDGNAKARSSETSLADFGLKYSKKLLLVLFLLLSLGLGGFINRLQPTIYRHNPIKTDKVQFSSLIWTYHFAYDNRGWPSLNRSAWLLNETGADVITLLESDASKPYLSNNDIGSWLGEKLGLYVDFGPSTRDHTWGNLILSKYPIVKSQHHLLPSPHGELAPAISATINISGVLVDFVTTHMGNDRDVLDRKLQAEYLAGLLDKSENPVIFMGYVTSKPGSRDYQKLRTTGRVKDIDETDRDRWCEYIMYRGLLRLGYARISHGGLSDTELQMARFRIPSQGDVDHDVIEIDRSRVPESQRFTDSFGGFGVGHHWAWTHKYHSSTPKYFLKRT